MSALDQMQAVLDQAPMMQTPCSRMAAAQQAAQPDMFSYMAVSRFGPALLSSLAEQGEASCDFFLDVLAGICIANDIQACAGCNIVQCKREVGAW